jgi:hypothetical protein
MDVYSHIFLTSALVGCEWSASRPGRFTPGTHLIGGWVDPRVGLYDVEKRKSLTLPGRELRPLGRPARSQSLYRLSYPGSRRCCTCRISSSQLRRLNGRGAWSCEIEVLRLTKASVSCFTAYWTMLCWNKRLFGHCISSNIRRGVLFFSNTAS